MSSHALKNRFAILLSIVFVSLGTSLSLAAEVRDEILANPPFSIVYLAVHGRAFVGYTDRTGQIAKFADCNAPAKNPWKGNAVTEFDLTKLGNCTELSDSSFLFTYENVTKINSAFTKIFVKMYEQKYRWDTQSEASAKVFATAPGVYFTSKFLIHSLRFIRANLRFSSARLVAAHSIIAFLSAGMMAIVVHAGFENLPTSFGYFETPEFERKVLESYRSLVRTSPSGAVTITLHDKGRYELIRDAIQSSVMEASSL